MDSLTPSSQGATAPTSIKLPINPTRLKSRKSAWRTPKGLCGERKPGLRPGGCPRHRPGSGVRARDVRRGAEEPGSARPGARCIVPGFRERRSQPGQKGNFCPGKGSHTAKLESAWRRLHGRRKGRIEKNYFTVSPTFHETAHEDAGD